jgi:predicted nucleotidyltransferase
MAIDVKTVMDTIEKYVTDVKQVFLVDKVYLYGSYAQGTQRWDSDVDVCFFLNDFNAGQSADIGIKLLGMTRKYDPRICIEPRVFPVSELYNDNPFVKEVVRMGYEIVVQ